MPDRRTTRRIVWQAIAVLLIGALVNIGVAWWCCFEVHQNGCSNYAAGTQYSHGTTRWFGFEHAYSFKLPSQTRYDFHVRSGWPLVSLESWTQVDFTTLPAASNVRNGIELEPHRGTWPSILFPRLLPLSPTWPEFAINSVLYGAVLATLIAIPLAIRRARRVEPGTCPKCAYPIGTSEICTECGAVVRSAR
jgi:hypothetical protein